MMRAGSPTLWRPRLPVPELHAANVIVFVGTALLRPPSRARHRDRVRIALDQFLQRLSGRIELAGGHIGHAKTILARGIIRGGLDTLRQLEHGQLR